MTKTVGLQAPCDPRIRELVDHVVVPALLERFLREQAAHDPEPSAPPPRVAHVQCPVSA